MALIQCSECQKEISDRAATCPNCGAPLSQESGLQPQGKAHLVKQAKSRGIYIILGLFFGLLGIHNFYAGRHGIGVAQLLTVAILGWFVIGIVVVAIWVLIELFTVKTDGAGDAFA